MIKVFLRPAKKTINTFLQKLSRLYEQGADRVRIGKYIQRWCKWLNAGLSPGAQILMNYQTRTLKVQYHLLSNRLGYLLIYGRPPSSPDSTSFTT
jgi:hypothetical protein